MLLAHAVGLDAPAFLHAARSDRRVVRCAAVDPHHKMSHKEDAAAAAAMIAFGASLDVGGPTAESASGASQAPPPAASCDHHGDSCDIPVPLADSNSTSESTPEPPDFLTSP